MATPSEDAASGSSTGIPRRVQDAERIAREVARGLARGRILPRDIERLGLSPADIGMFLKEVEKVRAQTGAVGVDSSLPTPTFSDLIGKINKAARAAKDGTPTEAAQSTGRGAGTLRGALDAIRDVVDFEYQDLLEEYYRSLADPEWRRKK